MSLVVVRGTLVWTDATGAIWTMPTAGGTPRELSNQHSHGFAFHVALAGDRVIATTKRDVFDVGVPDGPVVPRHLGLAENPEAIVTDDAAAYVTLFQRDGVFRIPLAGGPPTKLFEFRRGVLAHHGATLYAASYATGEVVAAATAGGAPKPIAHGFVRPTAIAVDDRYAFVYTERDEQLHRVELATGATITLASGLHNSDVLVGDGDWIYTYSWPGKLVRIAKSGGEPQVIAADLGSPYGLAIADDAIFVTSRDQRKIIRFSKSALR